MLNVFKCFLDIKEGHYYMLAMVEAFHNGPGETKRWIFVDLGFLNNAVWILEG